jgi:glucan biosynthesis protein C
MLQELVLPTLPARKLPARTHALDNLRNFLTVLVIFHHAALAYGGIGSWGYRSPYHPPGSSSVLTAFNVINQSFFMGVFFLLSGYFSSIAAIKKTRGSFLKEKFKRLGVPTLFYSVFAKGIMMATVARRGDSANWEGMRDEFMAGVKSTRGVRGPMWYTALLLVFDTIYVFGWPMHFFISSTSPPLSKPPSGNDATRLCPTTTMYRVCTEHVLIALLGASVLSFVIRIRYPFGHIFVPLNLNLGYLPQYILYYSAGIWLHRSRIPLSRPCSSRTIAITSTLAAAVLTLGSLHAHALISRGLSLAHIIHLAGISPNLIALTYSLFNELIGFTLTTLILAVFHSSILSKRWSFFGFDFTKSSYGAFIVHIPVLIETMTAIDEEAWSEKSAASKTVAVGMLATAKSWVFGAGIKRVVERLVGTGYL